MNTGRRRDGLGAATGWLITGGVVLVVVLLIAVLGGFAPAADHGRRVPSGQPIEVGEWRFVVHSAEFINVNQPGGYQIDDTMRVRIDVTHLGDETVSFLPHDVVRIATAPEEEVRWRHAEPNRNFAFDPQVTEEVVADVVWPQEPPQTVRVVIRDLRWNRGLLWDDWQAGADIAHVDVPVTDRRQDD